MSGVLGTFGDSPAAKTLAKILHEANDERGFAKVGKVFSTFNLTLNELSKIDSRVRFNLARMIYGSYKENCKTYPEHYRTYLSNVISGSYRKWLTDNNSHRPYKFRDDFKGKKD